MEIVSVAAWEGGHGAGQQAACNCLWMFSFQAASLVPTASLDRDLAICLAHPVGRAGAMMGLQGGERPVRVGQHVDAALRADQNGHISRVGRLGGSFRRFQNRLGVIEKYSHTELIGTEGQVFGKIRLFVAQGRERIDPGSSERGNRSCCERDGEQDERRHADSNAVTVWRSDSSSARSASPA